MVNHVLLKSFQILNHLIGHLKLELLMQLPASNDEKYIDRKGIPPGRAGGRPFLSM